MSNNNPGLFGIQNSNKDFSDETSWGKNQFNNTFPAGLVNYMHSKGLELVYIKIDPSDFSVKHEKISVPDFYGVDPTNENIHFAFEAPYIPYVGYVSEDLPRVDLVVSNGDNNTAPIEIKLTALPDDQTSNFGEEDYGSEIVVRPDTIVYLALSLIEKAQENGLTEIFTQKFSRILEANGAWLNEQESEAQIPELVKKLDEIIFEHPELESPILLQPIWKTRGKSSVLEEHCLDAFVWSNFAFTRLFTNQVKENESITRPERTVIWLAMMLYDFAKNGTLKHQTIIDTYTYGTKNDKAFAIGGLKTREYMRSEELIKPRIKREEIPKIILGDGQKLLSPERRFDGVVQSTVELFEDLADGRE